MIPCLFWKEKVVLRSIAIIFLFFISYSGSSQVISDKQGITKITLITKGMRLREVVKQLGEMTGLHFIYSTDKVEMDKRVAFNIYNSSLEEVFDLLGKKMNVTFKKKDGYVIIKAALALQPDIPLRTLPAKHERTVFVADAGHTFTLPAETISASSGRRIALSKTTAGPLLPDGYLTKNLLKLLPYFDTAVLKKLPPQIVRKINANTKHSGWFISAGMFFNDHSVGTELQGGIRSLYGVFTPGWLSTGKFRGAYGLGTSFLLSRNFSINPVYSYSVMRQEKNFVARSYGNILESNLHSTSRHHQVKLMLQYAVSPNINFRIGPSFNNLRTTRYMDDPTILTTPTHSVKFIVTGAPRTGLVKYYSTHAISAAPANITYRPPGDYRSVTSWIGWEVSFSYRLNFFKRP